LPTNARRRPHMTHISRRRWFFPRVLAHRGGGSLAPENTLAGLRAAADHGFRGVEFDAKLTRDRVAILMHDDTLERTTSGLGPVAQADWDLLRRLDAGSRHNQQFSGEPIPTLAAALRLCEKLRLWPNVEIKPCPGRDWETGAAVAHEVLSHWTDATPPLLSSFSMDALEAAREAAPHLPRGLLVAQIPEDWRARVRRLSCFSLHCEQRAATIALLQDAAAAGYPVLCYTVNRPHVARRLLSLGVSAIVTDRLDLIPPA
jgi:glycerophosphoryl diester phosphodiesterase